MKNLRMIFMSLLLAGPSLTIAEQDVCLCRDCLCSADNHCGCHLNQGCHCSAEHSCQHNKAQ